MKMNVIRAFTVAGMIALSASAHASPIGITILLALGIRL
jgi:hypothetical protein